MATIHRAHGLRIIIFTDDHEPAHVHAFGDGQAKINLIGLGGAPVLVWAEGMKANDLRRAMQIVRDEQAQFLARWGNPEGFEPPLRPASRTVFPTCELDPFARPGTAGRGGERKGAGRPDGRERPGRRPASQGATLQAHPSVGRAKPPPIARVFCRHATVGLTNVFSPLFRPFANRQDNRQHDPSLRQIEPPDRALARRSGPEVQKGRLIDAADDQPQAQPSCAKNGRLDDAQRSASRPPPPSLMRCAPLSGPSMCWRPESASCRGSSAARAERMRWILGRPRRGSQVGAASSHRFIQGKITTPLTTLTSGPSQDVSQVTALVPGERRAVEQLSRV
ncbi:hypothetical protein DPM13_14055 [Paracoccus mutanolyticus]|uniref:DUF4160 domain-containing protein n=1 Tax=Paracoccus mutanolyticus TaxID=1499308 RepID=A0ABN5M784_9RHOB|nr:hypothetical protein DPM13_14055 [Paracoccus mutanolyticus]